MTLRVIKITKASLLLFAIISASSLFANGTQIQNFQVEDFEMGNMLSWNTSTETQNKEFVVERSTDGTAFITIGTVKAKGNSSVTQSYSFLDISADRGATAYRLKQINIDGTFITSATVSINKAISNNFTIASMTPLEQQNIVEITLDVKKDAAVTYMVEQYEGMLIYTATQYLQSGRNIITIDISELEVGTYKISLKGDDETESIIFKTGAKKNVEAFADFDDGKEMKNKD